MSRSRVFCRLFWPILGLALVATGVGWVQNARAAESARLVYIRGTGAEKCPDEAGFRQKVAQRLGYDPFQFQAPILVTVEMSAASPSGSLLGKTQIVDGGRTKGTRSLKSPDATCTELSDALALGVSIALDPSAALSPKEPPKDPPKEGPVAEERVDVPPPIEPPPPKPPPAAPAPPEELPPIPWTMGAAIATGLGFGVAPGTSWTQEGSLFARRRWFSASLGARWDVPSGDSTDQGGRVRTTMVASVLRLCGHWSRLSGCASGFLGGVLAESVQVTAPQSSWRLSYGPGITFGGVLTDTGVFALDLVGDGYVVPRPLGLQINGRTVYEASSFQALLKLQGNFRFF